MLNAYIATLTITLIVFAGLITGLLFAFSNFVMRALALEPNEAGMRAMQRINLEIINPLFLLLFVGSGLMSAVLLYASASELSRPGCSWLMAGSISYLAGPIGTTAAFNVPLNNTLAHSPLSQCDEVWPSYVTRWLYWNHWRSALGILALLLLSIGLYRFNG